MKNRPGIEYQKLVGYVAKAFDPGSDITVGEWIQGPDGRLDMDVSIRGTMDNKPKLAVIECKDFSPRKHRKVGRAFVDALDSKRVDLNADLALMCSNSGFTADALRKAKRVGIGMISVLHAGDNRVKIIIEEEIYFRRIKLEHMRIYYSGPDIAKLGNIKSHDITYGGYSVDNWLQFRAGLIAQANPGVQQAIRASFRLLDTTTFKCKESNVLLDSLAISFTPVTQWYSQSVKLDAALGLYDYLRGRVKLAPGKNQYIVRDLDFSKGTPIDPPPAARRFNQKPAKGEIGLDLIMIEQLDLDGEALPSLEKLVEPKDLEIRTPDHTISVT